MGASQVGDVLTDGRAAFSGSDFHGGVNRPGQAGGHLLSITLVGLCHGAQYYTGTW